jgi:hypothetical protein
MYKLLFFHWGSSSMIVNSTLVHKTAFALPHSFICAVQSVICCFNCYCINLVISAHNCQLMCIGLMHTNLVILYLAVVRHLAVSGTVWLQFTTLLRTWHTDAATVHTAILRYSVSSVFGANPALCVTVTGHNTLNKQDTLFLRRSP